MTDERHPAVCSAADIRGAYQPGLRIVWDENGTSDIWEIVETDETTVRTRFTAADGTDNEMTSSFEELSAHSSFPIGLTSYSEEDFETPAGHFHGTHVTVATPDGDRHFYFSDDHPGPPIRIEAPGLLRQQIERSDIS